MPPLTPATWTAAAGEGERPADERAESAPRFWRSVAESGHEAPAGARPGDPGPAPVAIAMPDRRRFFQGMGATLALAATGGCSRVPLEKIVPYRDGPAQQTYGEPVFHASTLPRDGYGFGVLVKTQMGRPIKIEGNPLHPESRGATDVTAQAAVLELWDPDRSQAVRRGPAIATWGNLLVALRDRLARRPDGRGLRLLTETVTSPSLYARIEALLRRYPQARWHQWQPVSRDNVHRALRTTQGGPADLLYRFDRARVILAFDGDFLDEHPAFVRHALDFGATRHAHAPASARSRLYAVESTPTLTGANADHRRPVRSVEIPLAVHQIAGALGLVAAPSGPGPLPKPWIDAIVADLLANPGASAVTAGYRQPPEVHALVHAVNVRLGNVGSTVVPIPVAAARPVDATTSLRELTEAMERGEVDTLVVSHANPVYTAPSDLAFDRSLGKVALAVHHGLYRDETARRCHWHVPAAHALESWGDLRSFDGTISLQQPAIAPLYGGQSSHELVAAIAGDVATTGRALVAEGWRSAGLGDTGATLDEALRSGFVAGSAYAPVEVRTDPPEQALAALQGRVLPEVELVFVPDSRVHDGRYANNAWLQELPKTLSQLCWDNAALMSPALAERLGVSSEDVVELRSGGRSVEVPAWIMPGTPDGSVSLALGYGRRDAGNVGNGRGADAYAIRTSEAPWTAAVSVVPRGRRRPLACTQTHGSMEGRDIVRSYPAERTPVCDPRPCEADPRDARTLYESPPTGPYAWAMSIDLGACIGCGACTIACQAENNVPVVGFDEVRNGREMHWIRVDRYWEGPPANPRTAFQPVPCMQCEHAPCEVVCPVEASVHDAQGINVQVYNRCVGTRFCSNNCPYKVRRFNFLAYSRDEPGLDAQRNPEVTVRMRGVMEKCNYCLQRITTAKIAADREGRALRDGEVVTACQAACPTRAIVFGDLADPASAVNRHRDSPHRYTLLAELNTRPRTTYLARLTNPAPRLAEDGRDGNRADDAEPTAPTIAPGSSPNTGGGGRGG